MKLDTHLLLLFCLFATYPLSGHTAAVVFLEELPIVIPDERAAPADSLPELEGVNLAGAEFGLPPYPGTYGTDYLYPNQTEIDYFMGKGMNVFRLPFTWENLQRTLKAPFNEAEKARLMEFVQKTTAKGAYVILDPHNYARYNDKVIGVNGSGVSNSDFANFWARLAGIFKNNPRVIFGLMNEPHDMPTETWLAAANAAINAIRKTDAKNWVFVPGNAWTGAWTWNQNWYGSANAQVMLGVDDPLNRYVIDAHQYFDESGSGRYDNQGCVSGTIGRERLLEFTAWLKQHDLKGFLGEFGIIDTPVCKNAMRSALSHIKNNKDVWVGWAYWAAGPWWFDYPLSIEPFDDGRDKPIMNALEPFLVD